MCFNISCEISAGVFWNFIRCNWNFPSVRTFSLPQVSRAIGRETSEPTPAAAANPGSA